MPCFALSDGERLLSTRSILRNRLALRVRRPLGSGAMSDEAQRRVSCSFRIDPRLADEMKEFIRHHAGFPLHLQQCSFIEEAIRRHMAYLEGQLDKQPQSPRARRRNKG